MAGLYESNDWGASWQRHEQVQARVMDIEIHPDTHTTIYLAAWSVYGIYRTNDDGLSWQILSPWLIRSVAIHPITPTIIFAGTGSFESGGNIIRSTNGGEAWQIVSSDYVNALTFAFDPTSPKHIYAGGLGNVFKSVDGGKSWISSGEGLPEDAEIFTSLVFYPEHPERLYTVSSHGIFTSQNQAKSWQPLWEGITVYDLVFHPHNPDVLLAGTEDGIYISYNAGTTWKPLGNCGRGMSVFTLVFDPFEEHLLWVGTGKLFSDGSGVWRCVVE
jgi:photosystem II stability/assembly factor-like uncharacterized protein